MENISTAFLFVNKGKLRHNLGRPSRSDFVQSEFVEVNHFEKRNKDSILHFSCNQRFGRVMAFLCPMDVSVV